MVKRGRVLVLSLMFVILVVMLSGSVFAEEVGGFYSDITGSDLLALCEQYDYEINRYSFLTISEETQTFSDFDSTTREYTDVCDIYRGIDIELEGYTLDCDEGTVDGHLLTGIYVNADDVTVKNCNVEGGTYGIFVELGVTGTVIEGGKVSGTDYSGVYFEGSNSDFSVTGVTIEDIGYNGIYVEEGSGEVSISSNIIKDTGDDKYAIVVESGFDTATIYDNSIEYTSSSSTGGGIYTASAGTVDCNYQFLTGYNKAGVYVNSDDVTVQNCDIQGWNHGIYVDSGMDDVVIDLNTISGTSNDGIEFEGNSKTVTVSNNVLDSIGHNGIILDTVEEANIIGNVLSDITYSAIKLDYEGTILTIDDNEISDVGSSGIILTTSSESATITNNIISSTSQCGIASYGGTTLVIDSNQVSETGNPGLCIYTSSGIISSNVIDLAGTNGIYLYYSDTISLEGNVVSDSSSNGINFVGSSSVTMTSNYFCSSASYDFYCSEEGSGNTGSWNFFDTVYTCPKQLECGDEITESGEYFLTKDLSCNGDGIRISADDVVLDCQGYTLNGDGSSVSEGFYLDDANNVELINCRVNSFYDNIKAVSSSGGTDIFSVENSEITNSGRMGIYVSGTKLNLEDSVVSSSEMHGVYLYSADDTEIDDSVVCSNGDEDIYCYGSLNLDMDGSYFDLITSECSGYSDESIFDCSNAPESIEMDIETAEIFPTTTFTNTYSCSEGSGSVASCNDGADNDLNGLIDCADSSCQDVQCYSCSGDYCSCTEGICQEVVIADAQQAVADVNEVFEFLFTYDDFLQWLEQSEVITGEDLICDDACAEVDMDCLFAEAGRSLCSSEESTKCTCNI